VQAPLRPRRRPDDAAAAAPATARSTLATSRPAGVALAFTVGLSFAAAAALYLATLAPTVTFEDSGELIAAAYGLGVPHEPGYPLWTMIAHLFTRLPIGNVAYRVNLMSALCTALAAALVAWTTLLVVDECVAGGLPRARGVGGRHGEVARAAGAPPTVASAWLPALTGSALWLAGGTAVAAGVLTATAATTWSQAIITEVYGLNAALVALLLLLTVVWTRAATPRARARLFYAVSFVLGLGLTAHDTFVVLLPTLALYGFVIERRLRPSWRQLAVGAGLFLAGLLPYLYLPLAASRHPVMSWGNAVTWTNFWRVVTRHQYVTSGHSGLGTTLAEFGTSVSLLAHQWVAALLALAVVGLVALACRQRALFWFALVYLVLTWPVITVIADFPTNTSDAFLNADDRALASVFYIPSYLLLALLIALGAWWLTTLALRRLGHHGGLAVALAVVIAVVPIGLAVARAPGITMHRYRFADAYIHNVLSVAAPHSLVMVDRDQFGFPLVYAQDVEGLRPDVVVLDQELLRRSWYLQDLARLHPELIAGSRAQVDAFLSAVRPFEAGQAYNGADIDKAYYGMIRSFVDRYERAGRDVYFTYAPDQRLVQGYAGESVVAALEARRNDPGKGRAAVAAWLTPLDLSQFDFAHLTDGTVPLDRNVLLIRDWYGRLLAARAQLLDRAGQTVPAARMEALARQFVTPGYSSGEQ